MKRDFLSIESLTTQELLALLDRAAKMKADRRSSDVLAGRSIAMIFEKPSTRTRISFEVAITELGASPVVLNSSELQLARWADIPVVNALSDLMHPCQALADLLTVSEHFGKLEGLTLAYLGDGNNVAHSLLTGCALAGMNCTVATPAGYEPISQIVKRAEDIAVGTGARIQVTSDAAAAVAGADVVYTDVWASMGQEREADERRLIFAPYQVNEALMSQAAPHAIVMHCLPAHRGEEITDDVIEGPRSVVWDEAENRLHTQKALLEWLLA